MTKKKVTYHSAITGKFVNKEYAAENPDTTVEITSCNLDDELRSFLQFVKNNWSRVEELENQETISAYKELTKKYG